jgi:hypothetical protein
VPWGEPAPLRVRRSETRPLIVLGSWGRLYVNRTDPTLFVETRIGFGYTLNLGNPVSWVVLVVFVTALAIPLVVVPSVTADSTGRPGVQSLATSCARTTATA